MKKHCDTQADLNLFVLTTSDIGSIRKRKAPSNKGLSPEEVVLYGTARKSHFTKQNRLYSKYVKLCHLMDPKDIMSRKQYFKY